MVDPTYLLRSGRLGITKGEPAFLAYRELILTTPGLGDCISWVTPHDETIQQDTTDGVGFLDEVAETGILAGVKCDLGATPMTGDPGEKSTEGLDGLRQRRREHPGIGARFAKWRAGFTLGELTASRACLEGSAHASARHAALCQENGSGPHRGAGGARGRRRSDTATDATGAGPALTTSGPARPTAARPTPAQPTPARAAERRLLRAGGTP